MLNIPRCFSRLPERYERIPLPSVSKCSFLWGLSKSGGAFPFPWTFPVQKSVAHPLLCLSRLTCANIARQAQPYERIICPDIMASCSTVYPHAYSICASGCAMFFSCLRSSAVNGTPTGCHASRARCVHPYGCGEGRCIRIAQSYQCC